MKYTVDEIASLIIQRLNGPEISRLREEFQQNGEKVGTKFVSIDNFLPEEVARLASESFDFENRSWREMKSFRESKLTTKQYDLFNPILGQITFALQRPDIIELVERITGIEKQEGDPGLYAGGLSLMRENDFLNPHIDNSHDQFRKKYRRLNLLFYASQDWTLEDGGNLELWDSNVRKAESIVSKFNRLALMETNSNSWHSVSRVTKKNSLRKCISNYYFSEISPTGFDYFHITSFAGRPEEPFKRVVSSLDNLFRNVLRKAKKDGFGKVDLYQGKR